MPSIAIPGAGPAGLALARILAVQAEAAGLPKDALQITLFERDGFKHARTDQIGTLDLHKETGMAAVKAAGLWPQFVEWARYEGEELCITDKYGTPVVHMKPNEKTAGVEEDRPEIDREKLMEILLKSVDNNLIQWGKKLTSVTEDRVLHFADGTSAGPFDLIVGCDGAWSKVTPLLTDVRPTYAGICGFETHIVKPEVDWPQIDKLLGLGSYFAYSDTKAMMSHRLGNNNCKINYWRAADEQFAGNLMMEVGGDEQKLSETVGKWFTDWLPELRDCVNASSRWRSRALYELPVGHTWEHRAGFTLMGDAAHLMTPFAGKGVNAAMKDGLELSECIVKCLQEGTDFDQAIRDFEQIMFKRTKIVQRESMFNKTHMFRADAPLGFMVDMMDVIFEAKGKNLQQGLLRWIPIKKSVFVALWLKTTMGALKSWLRPLLWSSTRIAPVKVS